MRHLRHIFALNLLDSYVLLKSQVEGAFIKIAGCVSFAQDDYEKKPSNMSSTFTTSWSLYLNRILGMQEHPAPHCFHITADKLQPLPRFFICKARRAPEKKHRQVWLLENYWIDCGASEGLKLYSTKLIPTPLSPSHV